MSASLILGLLILALLVLLAVFYVADGDPALPEKPICTKDDPRCVHVAVRLAEARSAMKARGIALLLDDRPAWPRVSSGNVVSFHRQ